MLKKILLSMLSGFVILAITWAYQNYDHTFSIEDSFFKNFILVLKDKIYPVHPESKANFVFVNTGKDLSLIQDSSTDWGDIAVSDREKIYKLIHYINSLQKQPLFTVLDIQFYYPYTINPQVDTALQHELSINKNILIPILKDQDGKYKTPLYKATYGISNYTTYGSGFNKFRILNQGKIPSIAIALQNSINKTVYKEHFFYSTCNNRLCLSAIWPTYYLTDNAVRGLSQEKSIKDIKKNDSTSKNTYSEFYNLGELLLSLEGDSAESEKIFDNKIVLIGNFQDDMHTTRAGRMSGSIILANIYLTLLNGQHLIKFSLLLILLIAFTAFSYVSIFSKMPEIKFKTKFIFSYRILKFIRKYLSYFGFMFILSMLIIITYNVQIALFIPSFIFASIAYTKEVIYEDVAPFVSGLNKFFIKEKITPKD